MNAATTVCLMNMAVVGSQHSSNNSSGNLSAVMNGWDTAFLLAFGIWLILILVYVCFIDEK